MGHLTWSLWLGTHTCSGTPNLCSTRARKIQGQGNRPCRCESARRTSDPEGAASITGGIKWWRKGPGHPQDKDVTRSRRGVLNRQRALVEPAAVQAMRWPSSHARTGAALALASAGFTRTKTRMLPRSSCTRLCSFRLADASRARAALLSASTRSYMEEHQLCQVSYTLGHPTHVQHIIIVRLTAML